MHGDDEVIGVAESRRIIAVSPVSISTRISGWRLAKCASRGGMTIVP
jgi:hypothetical protein